MKDDFEKESKTNGGYKPVTSLPLHGYNDCVVTFACDYDVNKGSLVTMDSSQKVRVAEDGECFIGVAIATRDGFAAVQLQGYFEFRAGEEIPVGITQLVADKYGGVKVKPGGIDVWVVVSEERETEDGIGEDWVGFII